MKKNIICNVCGKEFSTVNENEVIKNDFLFVNKDWGFFSKKDGKTHQFVVCEECYDHWIQSFSIPVEETETLELI